METVIKNLLEYEDKCENNFKSNTEKINVFKQDSKILAKKEYDKIIKKSIDLANKEISELEMNYKKEHEKVNKELKSSLNKLNLTDKQKDAIVSKLYKNFIKSQRLE